MLTDALSSSGEEEHRLQLCEILNSFGLSVSSTWQQMSASQTSISSKWLGYSKEKEKRPTATKHRWGGHFYLWRGCIWLCQFSQASPGTVPVPVIPAERYCRISLSLDSASWQWTTCRTHSCTPGMSQKTDQLGSPLTLDLVLLLNVLVLWEDGDYELQKTGDIFCQGTDSLLCSFRLLEGSLLTSYWSLPFLELSLREINWPFTSDQQWHLVLASNKIRAYEFHVFRMAVTSLETSDNCKAPASALFCILQLFCPSRLFLFPS